MPDPKTPLICDLSPLNRVPMESLEPVPLQSSMMVWNPQGSEVNIQGVSVRLAFSDSSSGRREEILRQLNLVLQGMDEKLIRGISRHLPLTIHVGSRTTFEREHPKYEGEAKSTTGGYYSSTNKIFIFTDRILKASQPGGEKQDQWFYSIFRHSLLHEIGHAVYYKMFQGAHTVFEKFFRQFPFPPLFFIEDGNVTMATMPDKKGAPNGAEIFAEGFREIFSRRFLNQRINYEKGLERSRRNPCVNTALRVLQTIEQKVQSL